MSPKPFSALNWGQGISRTIFVRVVARAAVPQDLILTECRAAGYKVENWIVNTERAEMRE